MSTRSLKKQSSPCDPRAPRRTGRRSTRRGRCVVLERHRVVGRAPLVRAAVTVSLGSGSARRPRAGRYHRVGRLDSNSAIARVLSASSSPSSETLMSRSVRTHVDAVVGVAGMDEHLFVLLVPMVHPVPVEGDQVLAARRPPDRLGVVPGAGLDHGARRPGSCSRTPRPSSGSACAGRSAPGTRRGRPPAGSSRSAGGRTRGASRARGCRRSSRRRRRPGSASASAPGTARGPAPAARS